jgi:hypothetical protein
MPNEPHLYLRDLINASTTTMFLCVFSERYGSGYVAAVAPTMETLDDINRGFVANNMASAEHTDTYPLTDWYPIATGRSPQAAIDALEARIAAIPTDDYDAYIGAIHYVSGLIDNGRLGKVYLTRTWVEAKTGLFTENPQTSHPGDIKRINFTTTTTTRGPDLSTVLSRSKDQAPVDPTGMNPAIVGALLRAHGITKEPDHDESE